MGEWTKEAVIEAVKATDATRVKVAITDIDGILRGKYIHKNKLLSLWRADLDSATSSSAGMPPMFVTTTSNIPDGTGVTPMLMLISPLRRFAPYLGTIISRSCSRTSSKPMAARWRFALVRL